VQLRQLPQASKKGATTHDRCLIGRGTPRGGRHRGELKNEARKENDGKKTSPDRSKSKATEPTEIGGGTKAHKKKKRAQVEEKKTDVRNAGPEREHRAPM